MSTDLTKGNSIKQIIIFAIPLFIGNLFQQLYTVVDSAIVGQMIGSDALAAVGTSTPITFFLTAILAGFIIAASILTSQYFGAKDEENMRKTVATAFILVMGFAALMSLTGVFGARTILTILKTPDHLMDQAVIYLQIFSSSIIFQSLYQFPAYILRGIGDSKTPLYFLIIACIVNVVLDIVFVMTFSNGIVGVAVATFVAQVISAVACMVYTMRKYKIFRFKPREVKIDSGALKLIMKYGVPSSVQQVVGSVGMLCLQGLVNSFGSNAMAAYTSAYKIDNFMMLPLMNLSVALSNFVGQNIGANKIDRVKESLRKTNIVGVGFALIASALIYGFSAQLMLIFVKPTETEIIMLGSQCLRALSPLFFLCAILNAYIGFFKGVGDVNGAMLISVSQIVIRIIVAYTLAPIPAIGIQAVWWCMPTTWVICTGMCIIRYKSGTWEKYNRFKNVEVIE